MCVIITQPKGTYLNKDVAEAMWKANPDGGGFAFTRPEGGIHTEKYMRFDQFWSAFEKKRTANRDQDFLVHFRIATHGSVCLDNVHPFQVDQHTVMAHNGIIHKMPKDHTGQDRSDTRMFIDNVLVDFQPTWLDNPFLVDAIEEDIGWSKLAFLTTDPELEKNLYILNRHKGTEFRGMWFSNSKGLGPFLPKPEKKSYTSPVVNPPKGPSRTPQTSQTGGSKPGKKQSKQGVVSLVTPPDIGLADYWDDIYPENWADDPLEDAISTEEANRRWVNIAEEHKMLLEIRENTWKYQRSARAVKYHAQSMRFYCDRCQQEVTMNGECACWDVACFICETAMPVCSCQSPRGVFLKTGEPVQKGVVLA